MTRQVTTLQVTEKNVGAGNWDTSRKSIDRVVIHTMVGTAASASSHFFNPASKVSAHYGVLLDGSIWHWVDENNTAYHAGNYAMNQRSLGIEHEDNGDYNGPRTDALYTTSAKLVKDICNFYGISIDREHIIKHSEVKATGCPDALDIDRIIREASGVTEIMIDTKVFENLVRKSSIYDEILKKLKLADSQTIVLAEIDKVIGYEDMIAIRDRQIDEANTHISDLQAQYSAKAQALVDAQLQINVLTAGIADAQKAIDAITAQDKADKAELQALKDNLAKPQSKGLAKIWEGIVELFLRT